MLDSTKCATPECRRDYDVIVACAPDGFLCLLCADALLAQDVTGLIFCGCGLAKYAITDTEGRWTFVCEECDPNLAAPIARQAEAEDR